MAWSPLLPGVLCSGSDDFSIRVWQWSIDAETAQIAVLLGHSHNVRAIEWNHEIPHLLISGSWDGQCTVCHHLLDHR